MLEQLVGRDTAGEGILRPLQLLCTISYKRIIVYF